MNGWTEARRQRQAELIRRWKPWEQATGPRTEEGKATVARNAWKGGQRQALRELARAVNEELQSARERLEMTDR